MVGLGGVPFGNEGDALFFAFADPGPALQGALAAQQALAAHDFAEGVEVRVRVGVDSGPASLTGTGTYVGLPLHQTARICAAARGGQVLVSDATRVLADALPPNASLDDVGEYRLKDLPGPLRLYELRRLCPARCGLDGTFLIPFATPRWAASETLERRASGPRTRR
jgi:class 3 adenylate cyclase